MTQLNFIDLFSGCGGLSLGLSMAGLQGNFAIERDPMAFDTFAGNFLSKRAIPVAGFKWPVWLEKRAWAIDELISQHGAELAAMQGQVQVLAGGPPCQGFSFAGRRQEADPRNMLFEKYVQVVDAIKPMALVLENVPGMKVAHSSIEGKDGQKPESYYDKLKTSLEAIGYEVEGKIVDASRFGVPQRRARLIVVGVRKHLASGLEGGVGRAFDILEIARSKQLQELRLTDAVTAKDAISDLRTTWAIRRACTDPYSRAGFDEAEYIGPSTPFQELMHKHCRNDAMDSLRLARHRDDVKERFQKILDECPRGVRMNDAHRLKYGLKKHRIYPMSAWDPAPTITTLPDDVLHYAEPRILTVRESARLQSFPDWFRFRGAFTTGGSRRTKTCPRYTQVGNAVPPLLARAIGLAITMLLSEAIEGVRGKQVSLRPLLQPLTPVAVV